MYETTFPKYSDRDGNAVHTLKVTKVERESGSIMFVGVEGTISFPRAAFNVAADGSGYLVFDTESKRWMSTEDFESTFEPA
jgi:hypothetical protein